MQIPVAGFDPSLRHWGVAEGVLDLDSGILDAVQLSLIEPSDQKGRQVRQNSTDLAIAQQLAEHAIRVARRSKVIFVEIPVGSQSARAMASYGICVGVLGAIVAEGIPLIEVTATESKLIMTGDKNATKQQMIAAAMAYYPDANWPMHQKKVTAKAEHNADAIAAIHAGVNTPVFQNLMRLFAKV